MNRAWIPALACLGTVLACSTTPVQPEPAFELVDSFEYSLELWVDGRLQAADSGLFQGEVEEEADNTPLADTLIRQAADGTFGTAFGSVEAFELSAGATVDTGLQADVTIEASAQLGMSGERCGYPSGTIVRAVAALSAAVPAAPQGDFEALDGEGRFDLHSDLRVRTSLVEWRVRGTAYFEITDDQWAWTTAFTPGSTDIDFFDGFSGLDAIVVSPDMTVGPYGCVDVDADLESLSEVIYAPAPGPLRVSGSYSLSIIIEVVS